MDTPSLLSCVTGLKGLGSIMNGYKFQLCQFHQVMSIRMKLTMHPKLDASKELLSGVLP